MSTGVLCCRRLVGMPTRTPSRSRPDICRTERRSDLVVCVCNTGNVDSLELVCVIGVYETYNAVSGICIPGFAFSIFAFFGPLLPDMTYDVLVGR